MAVSQLEERSLEGKVVTVKLFESFHQGFGDADWPTVQDSPTPARYNRVHGSFDARWPHQAKAGFELRKIASPNHDLKPVFGVGWVDVTNNVYPATYYLVGRKIMKIRFGVVSEVGSNILAANATGGMFDDDGSGVPYLYACFGGDPAATKIQRMNVSGVVTQSTDVVAGLLLSLNGDAYRTIKPTGGTAVCRVSKCPYGNNRMLESEWDEGVTVGRAGTDINVLTAVRNAPVAIKPEGIFAYNRLLDRWINHSPSWENFFHLDNGKGAFFLGDVLIIPMGDGGMFVFDGVVAKPFDPGGLLATPNLHTTRDKFAASAAMRHWLIGATKSASKAIFAGTTLRFLTQISSVFTDYSANVRDADLTTGATFSIGGTGDFIWVGWDRPFTTIHFATGAANTVARTLSLHVNTTAGLQAVNVRDFTRLNSATLGQTGDIVMMEDPVEKGWDKTVVNGIEAYWARLSFSGALSANVTWLNCLLSPWYPSVDPTVFPLDGIDRAGNLPHLLFGRYERGEPIWHDVLSLPEPDDIGVILFTDAGGTSLNHSRSLLVIGRFCTWMLMVADNDRPGTEPAPFLAREGLIEAPSIEPVPGRVVRLREVRVLGHEFDSDMPFYFYYSWDWGKSWSRLGVLHRSPGVLVPRPDDHDRGNRFRYAFGFKQSAAGLRDTQPSVIGIEADFEVLPVKLHATQERPLRAQPAI